MMKWFFAWVVCALMLVLVPAGQIYAQATDEPLMGSEASPDFPSKAADAAGVALIDAAPGFDGGADGIFRVLVVGDGLAGGLGAGMTRMVEDNPSIEIVNRFNESSGLARPEVYDWSAAIPKIMEANSYDAVVVLIGSNDRQIIRDGENRVTFQSAEWTDFYSARVDSLLETLKNQGVKIFWVSVPPMADPEFDANMKFLSDIQRRYVQAKGGKYIDVRSAFLATDGSYVDRGPDETGVDRKLRSRDGVTFMKQGNNRFGQLVVNAIGAMSASQGSNAVAEIAKPVEILPQPAVVVSPNVVADTNQPVVSADQAPSFGQEGLGGAEIAFNAAAVLPEKPKLSVAQKQPNKPVVSITDVRNSSVALQGSSAEKLFTTGESGIAPAGRFDDFNYVATP